jgi:hypothetical protein
MAKEVKNPRKPATKKVAKEKKVEEVTTQVEGNVTPAPDELVELKPEDIVTNVDFNETTKEKVEEGNQLDPQEVIEEFTEAAKKLDNIVLSKNPEETLKKELERANEISKQLEEQIKEKEANLYKPNTSWNGVSDGWFDY